MNTTVAFDEHLLHTSREYIESREYWLEHLRGFDADALPSLLGADEKEREKVRFSFTLEQPLAAKLWALCKQNELSAYVYVMAAYTLLVHKYTGAADLLVPIPSFTEKDGTRNHNSLLPLRCLLTPGSSFKEHLIRVRQHIIAAGRNQHYRMAGIYSELFFAQPDAVFDIAFSCESLHGKKAAAELPVSIVMETGDEGIRFSGHWPAGAVLRPGQFLRHLQSIIEYTINHIQEPLSSVPLLDSEEYADILRRSGAGVESNGEAPQFMQLLLERLQTLGGRVALESRGKTISYDGLEEITGKIAAWLESEWNIRRGSRVMLATDRTENLVPCIIAIWRCGAVYVPVDISSPPDRIRFMGDNIRPALVLTDEKGASVFSGLPYRQANISLDAAKISSSRPAEPVAISPSDEAYIIFTSGSTGVPKGVSVTHGSLDHFFGGAAGRYPLDTAWVMPCTASHAFDISVFQMFLPLLAGGTSVMIGREELSDPDYLASVLEKASVIDTVPALYRQLADYITERKKTGCFGHVAYVFIGGDSIPDDLLHTLASIFSNATVVVTYGPTEATIFCTEVHYRPGEMKAGTRGSVIGFPIKKSRVYIADSYGNLLPDGVYGEICIGGPGAAKLYVNAPELTAEKFVADPHNPGSVMYRSGDTGRRLPNGAIEFGGRNDRQVKIRGYRIEPGEIESRLRQLSGIRDAVVQLYKRVGNELFFAVFYTGERRSGEVLSRHLARYFNESVVPSHYVHLQEIPLNINGKVSRPALRAAFEEFITAIHNYTAPRNRREAALVQIWEEVLERTPIGIHHNFFETGGHSLLAMRVISLIRKQFSMELSVRDIFAHPTVALLSERLFSKPSGSVMPPVTRGERPERIPLSYSQGRLWFIHQLQGSLQYHIPVVLRLEGSLDITALQNAIRGVMGRHEVLRTVIAQDGDEAFQRVLPQDKWQLQITDGTHSGSDEEKLRVLVEHSAGQPFDLTADYMLRGELIRLAEEEHVLVMTLHHIASDGWSGTVLVRELIELYRSYCDGRAAELQPLEIQYADYAMWQREYLSGELLERKMAYWKETLEGTAPLILPTDHIRPAVQSSRGGAVQFSVDKAVAEKLQALSRQTGSSLFMTLLAAFKTLLYRYSGQSDICVGSPVAGRTQQETEGLIGFFINTLALRSGVQGGETFLQLLEQVKETTLAAYEHQEVPFEKVVEAVVREREMSRSPLFQVMFVLQNNMQSAGEENNLNGLQVSYEQIQHTTSQFDLSLQVTEDTGGLSGVMEYSLDLYKEETIGRMLEHFSTLLGSIAADPTQQIGRLHMLPESEKLLLESFSGAEAVYPQHSTIIDLLEEQVAKTPAAIALVFGEREISYEELDEESNRMARYLRERGVREKDLIGICMERSPEMIIGMLAIMKAGAAYVPIDPAYPATRIGYMLGDLDRKLVLASLACRAVLEAAGSYTLVIPENERGGVEAQSSTPPLKLNPEWPAYVIYTSGSTGKPKGVVVGHRSLVNLVACQTEFFGITAEERILQFSSCTFDASVEQVFLALVNGARLVLVPEFIIKDIPRFERFIEEYRITHLHATPSFLRHLPGEAHHLKRVVAGGEVCSPELYASWHGKVEFINEYGPTETTVTAMEYRGGPLPGGLSVPIGKPLANTKAYIVDAHGNLCPIGVPGELYIGGVQVAQCYLNRPELTAERFLPDPFGEGRVYRTGDFARWLPDGNMEYIGRLDNQVKIRGYRIETGEIETALDQCRGIRQSAVLAREDASGTHLVAFIVTGEGYAKQEVISLLESRLPEYMVPAHFVELESMPLTSTGKTDRIALEKISIIQRSGEETGPKNREMEEKLAAIWKDLLRLDEVETHKNFFELGGHSILATRLMHRIQKELGIIIDLRTIFTYPTIRRMAAWLQNEAGEAYMEIEVQSAPDYPLTHAQQSLWMHQQVGKSLAAYNMCNACFLEGRVDREALEKALRALVSRHQSLRTRFTVIDGSPRQQVMEMAEVGNIMEQIFLSAGEHIDKYARMLYMQESTTPFDLEKGCLIRVKLLQYDTNKYFLLTTIHHIVSDEWSMEILDRELSALYNMFSGSHSNPLPPLRIQYKDYAVWEQRYMNGPARETHRNYWTERLAHAPQVLDLPTDRPRPAVKTYNGNNVIHQLSRDTVKGLKETSAISSSSTFMLLLSAAYALLYRYTRQEKIVIGIPVAGRNHSDLADQIGYYVNTIPLLLNLDAETKAEELHNRVREGMVEAHRHQRYPLDLIIDELGIQRDFGHSPLFDVIAVYQNKLASGGNGGSWQGFTMKDYNTGQTLALYDLSFYFSEEGEEITVAINYNTDLFNGDRIRSMLEHYEAMLAQLLTERNVSVGQINYLPPPELHRMLHVFNNTATPYPRNKTIHELFAEQVARSPEAAALVCDDSCVSYAELDRLSGRLAAHICREGYAGQPIGVLLDRSDDYVVSILGILKAGGIYVPVDTSYPKKRVREVLEEAGVRMVITHSTYMYNQMEEYDGYLFVTDIHFIHLEEISEALPDPVNAGSTAYIMFTSGSTGKAKGVMVPHRAVARLVMNTNYVRFTPGQRLLLTGSVSFDATTFEIWGPLLNGGELHILPQGRLMDPQAMKQYISGNRINIMWMTSSWLNQLVVEDITIFEGLGYLIAGGDRLSTPHINQLIEAYPSMQLVNGYGPTENTTFSICHSIIQGCEGEIPVGRPISNTTVYILDPEGHPVPIGINGEIYLGGDGLALGYVHNPELTEAKFVNHPFVEGARLYRTGDYGRWMNDGTVQFFGRMDNQVKIRGFRIELEEIQNIMLSHPAVEETYIKVHQDPQRADKQLVAYFTADAPLAAAEMCSFLGSRLPPYMVPAHFIQLERLPLNINGKLDVRRLPVPGNEVETDPGTYLAPRNAVEQKMVQIWEEVLQRSPIGVRDNFFEAGGHSLKATQVLSRIYKAINARIDLGMFFSTPTIEQLAKAVEESGVALPGLEKPEKAPEQDHYPLSYSQKRLWALHNLMQQKTAYNICGGYLLKGALDAGKMEEAVQQLLERHEILRTVFITVNGEPRQKIITADASLVLVKEDWTGRNAGMDDISRWVESEQQEAFDLASFPLMRIRLIRLSENEHAFIFRIHHILVDGWSVQVLNRDLSALYNGLVLGTHHGLPELEFQYKDLAFLQENEAMKEDHRAYWKSKLPSGLQPLNLPFAGEKNQEEYDIRVASQSITIEKELTGKLRALSASHETSLFSCVLTAVNILLSHHCGQENVVVSNNIASRDHFELEHQVGFYLNMALLYARVQDEDKLTALLMNSRQTVAEALVHHYYPLDRLLQELPAPTGAGAFTDVLIDYHRFNLNTEEEGHMVLEGVQVMPADRLEQAEREGKFNMCFVVQENEHTIQVLFEYNSRLFTQPAMQHWLDDLMLVLQSMAGAQENGLTVAEVKSALTGAASQRKSDSLKKYRERRAARALPPKPRNK